MKEFVINKNDEGQKLKKLCFRILDKAPASFTYKMLRKKNISLNDKKATGDEQLKAGDIVRFYLSDETFANFSSHTDKQVAIQSDHDSNVNSTDRSKILHQNDIIYMDDDIMAINKGYGILSQKSSSGDISVNEMMLLYLKEKGLWNSSTFKPSVCNRLDRNTTGLILAGISIKGLQFLTEAIRERKIDKYYHTICTGRFEKACKVRSYLRKDEKNNQVDIKSESEFRLAGSPKSYTLIETEFRPVSYSKDDRLTLLEVKLITGKSHQIRAQLEKLRHPILGDRKYKGRYSDFKAGNKESGFFEDLQLRFRVKGQLLHAYKIRFNKDTGDYSGKELICPYPKNFSDIISEYF